MKKIFDEFKICIPLKEYLGPILDRIRDEFKQILNIYDKNEIRVGRYGLTGTGLYFINSTFKV